MADTLYEGVIFKEHPILATTDNLSEDDIDYGITAESFLRGSECPIDKNFIEVGTNEFSQRYYSIVLLNKLSQLSTSQVDDFLDYQIINIIDKKRWLLKLERLVEVGNTDIGLNLYSGRLVHVMEPLRNQIKKYQEKNKNSTLSGSSEVPSFTYKQLARESHKLTDLFHELKTHELIAHDTKAADFKKVFSGLEVTRPVVWTGNASEFSYFIKLIHNEYEFVENLKQKQWKIALQCFVDTESNPFRDMVRKLQIPKRTAKLIEKSVDLLK